jgi:signal transduction histidine kinase
MGQNKQTITSCHDQMLLIERQQECIRSLVFALCHKLRGPVATASGLISLLEEDSLTDANVQVINLLKAQISELDRCLLELMKKHENLILLIG